MNRVFILRRTTVGRTLTPFLRRAILFSMKSLRLRNTDVALSLVDEREIRSLNHVYRKKNRPTDVLSFQQRALTRAGQRHLGDIVLSLPTAKKQAPTFGRTFRLEAELLTIHGLLHLCGYDHQDPKEEKAMFALQERLLERSQGVRT